MTGIWQTADGRKLKIGEMTDQHLANAIRFCEREYQTVLLSFTSASTVLRGEMALDAVAHEERMLEVEGPNAVHPGYDELVAEQHRRKQIAEAEKTA